jgi:hypothetical protein
MVHPTTGEMISSCKQLMHDPDTAKIWQTAFGKNFGGMAQGDKKTGQKGTNSIFVMTHNDIKLNPCTQTIKYTHVIVNFHPQKANLHRIRITAGGNLINYPGELSTHTAKSSFFRIRGIPRHFWIQWEHTSELNLSRARLIWSESPDSGIPAGIPEGMITNTYVLVGLYRKDP